MSSPMETSHVAAPADAQPEPTEMASPPTEPYPGPAVETVPAPGPSAVPVAIPVPTAELVPVLVLAAESAAVMIFYARVINLRVYNAGQNVLRQQAAVHFAPDVWEWELHRPSQSFPPMPNRNQ